MMDDYIAHLKSTNNQSLIARIYGIFTFKSNRFAPINVIVMQNTSKLTHRKSQKMIFDMKGSTVDRKVSFEKEDQKFWFNYLD